MVGYSLETFCALYSNDNYEVVVMRPRAVANACEPNLAKQLTFSAADACSGSEAVVCARRHADWL